MEAKSVQALSLRSAGELDMGVIAEMNFRLIQDEGSSNPMTVAQLKQRAIDWLKSGWNFDLICTGDRIIGYALYQIRPHPYNEKQLEAYIRQYFIESNERQKGYGRKGINLLKEKRFKEMDAIVIDVLETNPKGRSFWERVGFKPYYTNMRMASEGCLP